MVNLESTMKNLEVQLGQIANLVSGRVQGTLPSDTEKNPREHIKAITLRSGKELDEVVQPNEESSDTIEQVQQEVPKKEVPSEKSTHELSKSKAKGVQKAPVHNKHSAQLPYPQRLKQEKLDKEFGKFMELFKQLTINIPFADALAQMPSYVKFMKEILTHKRKIFTDEP